MRARFIHQIGIAGKLRIYWDKVRSEKVYEDGYSSNKWLDDCPSSYGLGHNGIHNACTPLGSKEGTTDYNCFGKVEDFSIEKWPTQCNDCAQSVPQAIRPTKAGEEGIEVIRQVFTWRLYNTASGKPEPGDLYWIKHEIGDCPYWDNCNGMHLHGIVPNGDDWDIDCRASNCTMPEDRQHRCWIKTGSPEDGTLHVDKNGATCAAGAGSIMLSQWHGFLHHFDWHT